MKLHLVSVDERHVLGVGVSAGQDSDAPAAGPLLAEEHVVAPGADRAYDTDAIRAVLTQAGKEAVIPPKSNRVAPPPYDETKYRGLNRTERLVGRAKQFRAVATRYDKLDAMFLGPVLAALTLIHLGQSVVNTT